MNRVQIVEHLKNIAEPQFSEKLKTSEPHLKNLKTFLFVVGKIMYHSVLGKYFVQYEKNSVLIGLEEIDNIVVQLL